MNEEFSKRKIGIGGPLPERCSQGPSQYQEPTSELVVSLPGATRSLLGVGDVRQCRGVGLMGDGFYFVVWFLDKGVRKKIIDELLCHR